MDSELLDYQLPGEMIAQVPAGKRDQSRLLVFSRQGGKLYHRRFRDITGFLSDKDLVVVNDTKVIKARMLLKRETGGKIELLFLRSRGDLLYDGDLEAWECLVRPSRKVKRGDLISAGEDLTIRIMEMEGEGRWIVGCYPGGKIMEKFDSMGTIPLPPYIKRGGEELPINDEERYQTVYASSPGSVAAPTAGLHFTSSLLNDVRRATAGVLSISLSVGYGTFSPIKTEKVRDHLVEPEEYNVSEEVARTLIEHKRKGGRVVGVGTTTVRVLESAFDGDINPLSLNGTTDLFIYPGYRFKVVDSIITNFHLPRSSLLALVMAFAGTGEIVDCYREAMDKKYRFFSYGDAMLIL